MTELRTAPRATLRDGRQVREVASYPAASLVEVYVHGDLSPHVVPSSELVIR